MMGQVFLVGAGPGDGGLMTLRGKALLDRADVVVYDALVGDEVLAMIPPAARCVNVGKRASRHTRSQEEIDRILLEEALAGHTVVRLKGETPSSSAGAGRSWSSWPPTGSPSRWCRGSPPPSPCPPTAASR